MKLRKVVWDTIQYGKIDNKYYNVYKCMNLREEDKQRDIYDILKLYLKSVEKVSLTRKIYIALNMSRHWYCRLNDDNKERLLKDLTTILSEEYGSVQPHILWRASMIQKVLLEASPSRVLLRAGPDHYEPYNCCHTSDKDSKYSSYWDLMKSKKRKEKVVLWRHVYRMSKST